ncbi:MAG: hypothetical protein MI725_10095 [Pirellulales bacterium]|nr:hypothetical protein [Pirellulales bacterium]
MATIIKREHPLHSSGASYDLSEMAGQADDYLGAVRAEAAKIIQEAKQESIEIRRHAEEAGREAAQAAVESILDAKVAKQLETLTPALATAVQQIEDSRQEWLRHWETSAVQFANAIAARIIRRELCQQPEIALEWIQETLQLAAGAAELTVRLHPTDYRTLGNQVQELAALFGGAAPATIVADDSVSAAGCVVTTKFGAFDMQLETQLARLAQELS